MTAAATFQDHYAKHTLGNPAQTTGRKTTSQLVYTGRVLLASIIVLTDGTNDATLTLYDAVIGSGKIVRQFTIVGSENFGGNAIRYPIAMTNGIYATISGTGAAFIVDYIIREL